MSDLISRSELILRLSDYALQESPNDNESTGEQRISKMMYDAIQNCISCVEEQQTAYSVEEVVEELEIERKTANNTYNSFNMDVDLGRVFGLEKAIEIVKQEAAAYEECYKDCGDCEAYNKEKHHCPKFCKVITETVREIEENHNKGKWEMTYKGKRKDVNTGLMISAYNCKCSVCGWETGNQGTRFSYCPKCGAKMDELNQPKGE